MFSAFRMGSKASGRGLCDIGRVLISVAESHAEKCSCTTKIYRLQRKSKNPSYPKLLKPKLFSSWHEARAEISQFFDK